MDADTAEECSSLAQGSGTWFCNRRDCTEHLDVAFADQPLIAICMKGRQERSKVRWALVQGELIASPRSGDNRSDKGETAFERRIEDVGPESGPAVCDWALCLPSV